MTNKHLTTIFFFRLPEIRYLWVVCETLTYLTLEIICDNSGMQFSSKEEDILW